MLRWETAFRASWVSIANANAARASRPSTSSPFRAGPEHGYGGEAQDMVGVASASDPRTGAPIVSLYGERFEDLAPRAEHLAA